jgi:hypothetical protein
MHRFALFIAPLWIALSVHAAEPDPLTSQGCVTARAVLDAALADSSGTLETRSARLAAARRVAARTCLGHASDRAERSGAPEPPMRVAPAAIAHRPESSLPLISLPAPPLAVPRPATISSCDPAGCWDSEGRRLNSQGPLLLGPRGPCLQQGGVVSCP